MKRRLLLAVPLVALFVVGIAGATLITFGSTDATVSSLTDSLSLNFKGAVKLTAPASGKIVEVDGYLDGLGKTSGSEKVRAIVYADSSGSPGAFLAVSNEL